MSRVASNYTPARYNNGHGQANGSVASRTSSNNGTIGSLAGRAVTVRSAAPPLAQKETVHACPLCNSEYKDPRVLPCTHTYCLNCVRDKLIENGCLTCPKCHHQVHSFDEAQLSDLPRNLILSQEWRMNARPIPTLPTLRKPVTYQPTVAPPSSMFNQLEKRKSLDINGHDVNVDSTSSHGIAAIVNAFNKSSANGNNGARSSRSSSVASTQPVVSNLVRIYSEVTAHKQSNQKHRSSSVVSTSKHDELTRIFEQASIRSHPSSSPSVHRRQAQVHEQAYEEIAWDTVAHGATPVAPPFPDQWHSATENHHQPPEVPQRPFSATSTSHQNGKAASPGPTINSHATNRVSLTSRFPDELDEDDVDVDGHRTPVQQSVYAIISPREHSRQASNTDSVQSGASSSVSRQSPLPSTNPTYQQRIHGISPQRQQQLVQDDKLSHRSVSVSSSTTRRSSDRFPPPPQNIETLDFTVDVMIKPRTGSSISARSSAHGEGHESTHKNEAHMLTSERFYPDGDIPPPLFHRPSRANSHVASGSSTPTNRPASASVEREIHNGRQEPHYLLPALPNSTPNVTSRVDLLLSDQKRLEREIDEQIKRLKYDYDDIRAQIDRKESSIHHEVKNIAVRLDEDITEHYHRKQKIYANLAADNSTVGSELERLKSNTPNNKQQLWTNLEQIETNIRNIRQAVEEQKEARSALAFAEGHRALAADTIGQITFNQTGSPRRHTSSPSPPIAPSAFQAQPLSTNISPYKYIKIDHLATLEPEAIAMTENNKKILLGICNKLFILNEHGDTLKVIPLSPSIRGIAVSKKPNSQHIAYISHDETVSMIDIESGQSLDSVKETDSTGDSGTFLPLGIDTDNIRGDVFVCDYRNSCVIKFDDKLEFITQWRIYNHSDQYDEARPKLISVYGQRLYMIVEHSCKPYYNQGIAYTFSLHICDANSGNIIKIIDAELLSTQRLRWPCSVQAINNEKCYILDTMTSGKYFNGQWQKHWSRVLEIGQDENNIVTELFQLDSEAATMAMTKEIMIIAANGDILFVDLGFLKQNPQVLANGYEHSYQNLP